MLFMSHEFLCIMVVGFPKQLFQSRGHTVFDGPASLITCTLLCGTNQKIHQLKWKGTQTPHLSGGVSSSGRACGAGYTVTILEIIIHCRWKGKELFLELLHVPIVYHESPVTSLWLVQN